MILSPKTTHIAFRCPSCGDIVRGIAGAFGLGKQDMLRLRCPCEGRAEINSGELVVSTKVAEADKAAKSSRVDEETETVEVKPAEEKKPAAPKKEEKKDDEDDLI